MAIDALVLKELEVSGATRDTLRLWSELWAAHEQGGTDAVKTLLQERVRTAKKRADQQVREMRSVAGAAAPKPRARKRKPVKRGR